VKLVERVPRVCKAVMKAKCGYFEDFEVLSIWGNSFKTVGKA
jgi:hypothetical protein